MLVYVLHHLSVIFWSPKPDKRNKQKQQRSSFENVPKWRAEARDIPVVLVGSKLDLCESQPPSSCVAVQEAQVGMDGTFLTDIYNMSPVHSWNLLEKVWKKLIPARLENKLLCKTTVCKKMQEDQSYYDCILIQISFHLMFATRI